MRRGNNTQVADSVPFEDPDFTSENVKDAIVEAKQNAEGFPRAGIRATSNGVLGDNEWIGPTELLPNTALIVAPVKLKINEITWANANSNVSFDIQFRKNSKTGTIFYTLDVNSPNSGYGFVSGVDQVIEAGEAVFAQYIDTGTNCSDLDIILWVSRIPE